MMDGLFDDGQAAVRGELGGGLGGLGALDRGQRGVMERGCNGRGNWGNRVTSGAWSVVESRGFLL